MCKPNPDYQDMLRDKTEKSSHPIVQYWYSIGNSQGCWSKVLGYGDTSNGNIAFICYTQALVPVNTLSGIL